LANWVPECPIQRWIFKGLISLSDIISIIWYHLWTYVHGMVVKWLKCPRSLIRQIVQRYGCYCAQDAPRDCALIWTWPPSKWMGNLPCHLFKLAFSRSVEGVS
jgi:hypothetical protein